VRLFIYVNLISVLILILDGKNKFDRIDLHQEGLPTITLKPTSGGCFRVDEHGSLSPIDAPVAVTFTPEQESLLFPTISREDIATMKGRALEIARRLKKERKEIVPYKIARRVVNELRPSADRNDMRHAFDTVRKVISAEFRKS